MGFLICSDPGRWWPRFDFLPHGMRQDAECVGEFPERSGPLVGVRQGELFAECCLIRRLQVADILTHSGFQLPLCAARFLGVPMRLRVIPHAAIPAQRLYRSQKPRFVFAVSENHLARDASGRRLRPRLYGRSQFGGAIRVSVEQNQNRCTISLDTRQCYRPLYFVLADKLVAAPSDWSPDADFPNLTFRHKAAQQNRECPHIAVTFDDRLNIHAG